MTYGLKPYPGYKDSGVPWLGEVPKHWDVGRLKSRTINVVVQTSQRNSGEPYVALEHVESWTGRLRDSGPDVTFDSQVRRFRRGDVLFGKLRPYLAKVTRPMRDGVCVGEFLVLRPRGDELLPAYLEQLLRSKPVIDAINASTFGAKMPRADWQFVGSMELSFPPIPEQSAIVHFLDYFDRRIRRYIRAKQKLITLQAERREAITDDALRLAGSRSLRLGVVADRIERLVNRRGDREYTPIGLYNRGRGIFHKANTMGSELGDSTFFWIAEGDFVLSGQFAWEGAVALAGQKDDGCVASHRYPVFRGKPDMAESAFLLSFFRTGWGQLLLDHHSRGAAGRNRPLNVTSLMKEKIPVPPPPVQKQIAALVHLESRTQEAVAGLVKLLREYRARLIADVVTGKLDVREASASLPKEVEEEVLEEKVEPAEEEGLSEDERQVESNEET